MYLIPVEGYKNAGIYILLIKKPGKIWVSIKNVHIGFGIKNISDPVLKEIYGIYETKTLEKSKLENIK